MDFPPKRPQLSFTELTNDDYDYDSDSDTNQQDPHDYDNESNQVDLQEARFHNDQRLKSIFEGIFEKYGKDFTDVGDEIDLQSGSILVNNGHIAMMDGEGDTGERGFWLFDAETPGEEGQLAGEGEGGQGDDDDDPADGAEMSGTSEAGVGGDGDVAIGGDEGTSYADRSYNLDGQAEERPEDEVADSEVEDGSDQASVSSSLDIRGKDNRGRDRALPLAAGKETSADTPLPLQSASARMTSAAATDPKWHFPEIEISKRFWTPPANRLRPPPTPINAIRSASPPGSGSLWALPGRRRNPGSTKKKPSTMASQRKRKRHSSPVFCDWSFAKTPDGSESDDPLQEDYEPSPTPRKGVPIRGKRRKVEDSTRVEEQSVGKEESIGEDQEHGDKVQPRSLDGRDGTAETPQPVRTTSENTALDLQPNKQSNNDNIHNSADTAISADDSKDGPAAVQSPTPIQRRKITPDEARLLVTMRQIHGKRWKEIRSHIPDKKEILLSKWFGLHWTDRQVNPLPLSAPWSRRELAKLDSLKNQPGLTWDAIRASIPGRPFAEVEFELLQSWVEDGMNGTLKE